MKTFKSVTKCDSETEVAIQTPRVSGNIQGCLPLKTPITPKASINKTAWMNLFQKKEKEKHLTFDQLWFRGLPNIARYALWPVMIGNPLQIDKRIYNNFKEHLQWVNWQNKKFLESQVLDRNMN